MAKIILDINGMMIQTSNDKFDAHTHTHTHMHTYISVGVITVPE